MGHVGAPSGEQLGASSATKIEDQLVQESSQVGLETETMIHADLKMSCITDVHGSLGGNPRLPFTQAPAVGNTYNPETVNMEVEVGNQVEDTCLDISAKAASTNGRRESLADTSLIDNAALKIEETEGIQVSDAHQLSDDRGDSTVRGEQLIPLPHTTMDEKSPSVAYKGKEGALLPLDLI